MKKLLISSAIAAAMGTSGFAQAVDFTAETDGAPVTYANEIALGTDGTVLQSGTNALAGTFEFGFGASAAEQRFVRFELSEGATFEGDPSLDVYEAGTTTAISGTNVTKSSGGAGENFVIFQVTAPDATAIPSEADVLLSASTTADEGIKVTNKSGVSLTYSQYQLASEAVNEQGALASDSGVLVSFVDSLTQTVVNQSSGSGNLYIDVAQESKYFTASTTGGSGQLRQTSVGQVTYGLVATPPYVADGSAVTLAKLTSAPAELVISGDFSGAVDATNPDNGVSLVTGTDCTVDGGETETAASSLTAESATFILTDGASPASAEALANSTLCFETDGETTLSNRSFNGAIELTAADGYTLSDLALGEVGSLSKNGSTAVLNLALTPDGAFKNFIRITNTSALTGDVFITVFNDDGEPANITLSDVAASAELSGNASTPLILIDDIYNAATDASATFGLGDTSNKLRLVIEGEFPSIDARDRKSVV